MEYPFYNLYVQFDKNRFMYLVKKYKKHIENIIPSALVSKSNQYEKFNDQYVFIQEDWNANEELNQTTDIFTERCRILCKFGDRMTPAEFWNKNKHWLMKNKNTSIPKIRDIIYHKTKLCNNFRISVCLTVLEIFNAKRWLDISAGWGDRLIAAIGANLERYVGVDPNDCLQQMYQNIIDKIADDASKHKYTVLHGGFEKVQLPNEKFDIVFSSPPFFDLEIYSESKDDSFLNYNTKESWFYNFLIPSLDKAISHLQIDGHLVLYMGEGGGEKMMDKMTEYLNGKMRYMGKIYYYYPGQRNARDMMVWKKINDTNDANNKLKRQYLMNRSMYLKLNDNIVSKSSMDVLQDGNIYLIKLSINDILNIIRNNIDIKPIIDDFIGNGKIISYSDDQKNSLINDLPLLIINKDRYSVGILVNNYDEKLYIEECMKYYSIKIHVFSNDYIKNDLNLIYFAI